MWINTNTGGLFELHSDIRYECWKESIQLPGVLTDEVLKAYGYYPVREDKPAYDMITHKLFPRAPELVDGEWVRGWNIVALPAERVEINRKFFGEDQIRQEFNAIVNQPVECTVEDVVYVMKGGYESANAILSSHNLAVALGETEMELVDNDKNIYTVPLEVAHKVAVQIGLKWRVAFLAKQHALKQLKET